MTKATSLPAHRRSLKERGRKRETNLAITAKAKKLDKKAIKRTSLATTSTPVTRRLLGPVDIDLTESNETENDVERALPLFQKNLQQLRFGSNNVPRGGLPSPADSSTTYDLESPVKRGVARSRDAHIKRTPVVRKSNYSRDGLAIMSCRMKLSSPRNFHIWTHQERQLLCLIRRFFQANFQKIADLMNAVFPKSLTKFRSSMISAQIYEMGTGSSGRDGEAAFSSIWSVADFNEARSIFSSDLDRLEKISEEHGISIIRREEEDEKQVLNRPRHGSKARRLVNFPSVMNRSILPQFERTNSACVSSDRLVCEVVSEQAGIEQLRHDLAPSTKIGVSRSCPPSQEAAKKQEKHDANRVWKGTVGSSASDHETVPKILFRAFSEQSSGTNTISNIRAGLFKDFVPAPIDTRCEMFACLANTHLTRDKIPTPFISASPSLVWVMHKLFRTESNIKNIAIINGPIANTHTRVYWGKPLLIDLRRRNIYPRNIQYSATCEYLVWGEIPREAIYGIIGLQHIEHLAKSSAAVGKLLRLDILKDSINIATARAEFLNDPVVLDGQVGHALAKIVLLFGFSAESDEALITEMIFHLLQGWAVQIPMDNYECLPQAFGGFLIAFAAATGPIALALAILEHKLRRAFETGVHQAAQAMVKDTMKRPSKKGRRNMNKFFVRNV